MSREGEAGESREEDTRTEYHLAHDWTLVTNRDESEGEYKSLVVVCPLVALS